MSAAADRIDEYLTATTEQIVSDLPEWVRTPGASDPARILAVVRTAHRPACLQRTGADGFGIERVGAIRNAGCEPTALLSTTLAHLWQALGGLSPEVLT